MHQSHQILRLGYLYSGCIYVYIYIHIQIIYRYLDIFIVDYVYSNISRTGTRKERPRERGSIRWLQSGSTDARSVGAVCTWQVEFQERNVDADMLKCQGEGCGMIMVHASENIMIRCC